MNMHRMPGLDLTSLETERCCRLAWFLYGWVEREHALNLNACATWWLQVIEILAVRHRSPAPAGTHADALDRESRSRFQPTITG